MTTLADFEHTDLVDDHLAEHVNELHGGNWSARYRNVQTITATLELTDADCPIQLITASGANRTVELAPEATTNHWTYVRNAGGSNNVLVKDDSGVTTFMTLAPGEYAVFVSDGSAWKSIYSDPDLSGYALADGWKSVSQTWTYASADDPVYQVYVSGNVTANDDYKVGNKIKCTNNSATVYGFIVKVGSYDGGNNRTPVDIYCGTDYDFANSAITAPYISKIKSPDGFPLDPTKWTVQVSDTTGRTQASAAQNTWYNLGTTNSQISIPIGCWNVSVQVAVYAIKNSATGANAFATLSTANNTESDADMTTFTSVSGASGNITTAGVVHRSKTISVASKTTYYLNAKTSTSGGVDTLGFDNASSKMIMRAVCSYL